MDIKEKDMTPDRRLRVRFNQVSEDNPFNPEAAMIETSDEEDRIFDKIGNISPDQRADLSQG